MGEVEGGVVAADRHDVGRQQMSLREGRQRWLCLHRCRSQTTPSWRSSSVVAASPLAYGAGHEAGRREIGALDHVQQVAQRRLVGGDGVQVGAQRLAGEARADRPMPAGAVEPIGDAVHVQERAPVALDVRARGRHQALDVCTADHASLDLRVGRERARLQSAARHGQEHVFHRHAGQPLGLRHGRAHRLLRLVAARPPRRP